MQQDDPILRSQPAAARDYFLACYTVALVQGQTILGTLIRHSTINGYLTAAYELFGDIPYESTHNFVAIILKAVQNYETVPKRRRMITDAMMEWLLDKATSTGSDSSFSAIVDWILLGRYTGFRASEYSQKTQKDYERIEDWPGLPSRATTRHDFIFLGDNERHLAPGEFNGDLIHYLVVTWRIQKNRMNGEKVTFGDDHASPRYSATRAARRIYTRSLRLGQKDHEPMGVYLNSSKKVKYITESLITKLLRDAASATLKIDRSHVEIKLWSTHSIRVTAANLLYRQQLSDHYIMTRLRWKSSAYLVYLRNTIHSANAHSEAISIKLTDKDTQQVSFRRLEPVEEIVRTCSQTCAEAA